MRTAPRFAAGAGGLLSLYVALSVTGGAAHAADLATIRLSASASVIKADGRSTTVLSAEVRDSNGAVVPDGTQVRFAVTAGRLETDLAATQNGVARVILTSGDLPASALVTANLETAGRATPAQITVMFSSDADTSQSGNQWIRIDGHQYVGYAADKGIIQANGKNGGARISYRNVAVNADSLQFTINTGHVVASGNVTLTVGDTKKTYANLKLELMAGQGVAERVDENGKSESLFIDTLPAFSEKPAADDSRGPLGYEGFQLADISDSSLTVTARSIAMQPGKSLQFRNATFYLDGTKTASLPFHVMSLDQKELFAEQVVGVTSEGVTVDFPLYYNVQPSGIGTLHIRRGSQVGSSVYSNKPGWSFDVEQNYNGKQNAEGTVEVRGLTRSDWGADFRHGQNFGAGIQGNIYVDVPNHQDLFSSAQLSRQFRGFALNLNASGSYSPSRNDSVTGQHISSGGDLRGQLYGSTDPRPLLKSRDIQYSLNLGTGRQTYYGINAVNQTLIDTHYTTLRLATRALSLAPHTTLVQSVSLGQTWVISKGNTTYGQPGSGQTVLGTTSLGYRLGHGGSMGLTYDYTQTPLTNGYTATTTGHHRLGMNLFTQPSRAISLTVGGSRGLDIPNDNASAELNIALGGPWRTRTRFITSRYVGAYSARYSELEYGVFYRLGARDLAVYYSTTSRRFQFDMVGARF